MKTTRELLDEQAELRRSRQSASNVLEGIAARRRSSALAAARGDAEAKLDLDTIASDRFAATETIENVDAALAEIEGAIKEAAVLEEAADRAKRVEVARGLVDRIVATSDVADEAIDRLAATLAERQTLYSEIQSLGLAKSTLAIMVNSQDGVEDAIIGRMSPFLGRTGSTSSASKSMRIGRASRERLTMFLQRVGG